MSASPTLTRPPRPSVARSASGAPPGRDPGAPVAPPTHRGVGLDTVLTALVALFGWVAGIARLSDNSFFWHLRTGEWILDHGTVPRHDVFSFTAPGVEVGRAVVARRAHVRRAQPRVRRVRHPGVRRARRCRGRSARLPARAAPVPEHTPRVRHQRRWRSRACSRSGRSARSCSACSSSWSCCGSSKSPTRSSGVIRSS